MQSPPILQKPALRLRRGRFASSPMMSDDLLADSGDPLADSTLFGRAGRLQREAHAQPRRQRRQTEGDAGDSRTAAPLSLPPSLLTRTQQRRVGYGLALAMGITLCAAALLVAAEVGAEHEHHGVVLTVAGVVTGAMGVVLTYVLVGSLAFPQSWTHRDRRRGGAAFAALQLMAWSLFTLSLLVPAVPVALWMFSGQTIGEGMRLAVAGIGVMAQVVMISSIFTFKHPTRGSRLWEQLGFIRRKLWWRSFVGLQLMLTVAGFGVAVMADVYSSPQSGFLLLVTALLCFTFAIFLTYGVGGPWRYHSQQWRFVQPGVGGAVFVVLQALAWTFFTTATIVFLAHVDFSLAHGRMGFLTRFFAKRHLPSVWSAGAAAVLAQIFNASSLLTYKEAHESDEQQATWLDIIKEPCRAFFVVFVFNLEKVVIALILLSAGLVNYIPGTMIVVWTICSAWYLISLFGRPSVTGARMWRSLPGHWLVDYAMNYFSFEVKNYGDSPLDPNDRYIFSFHPHAIMPMSCALGTRTTAWQKVFPNVVPALLSGTILHFVPIIRDVLQAMGGLEVSHEGFHNGLGLLGSVVLTPGGQKEMLYSASWRNDVTLDTTHKGFVKVAMQCAARQPDRKFYLVPLISFGETEILDNVQAPWLQRQLTKIFHANVLFIPYGAYNLPGVPRRRKLVVVAGRKIEVPAIGNPTVEQVEALHAHYLFQLKLAFERGRREMPEYGRLYLELKPDVQLLDDDEFEVAWMNAPHNDDPPSIPKKRLGIVEGAWMLTLLSMIYWSIIYGSLQKIHERSHFH